MLYVALLHTKDNINTDYFNIFVEEEGYELLGNDMYKYY